MIPTRAIAVSPSTAIVAKNKQFERTAYSFCIIVYNDFTEVIFVKKMFLILLLFVLVFALFKANIFDFEEHLSIKETVRCQHEDVEWMLQIYSNGDVSIQPMSNVPVNVIIPKQIGEYRITHIADYAFSGYKNIKTIECPDTITHVGDYAFWDCESLVSIVFPEKKITIDESAFTGCNEALIKKIKKANPNAIWS